MVTTSFIMYFSLNPGTASAQEWELVWEDTFEADSLDLDKWSYQYGTGTSEGLVGWGNNELQFYTDREENIYLEDGKLHIRAKEESHGNRDYTSARIRSINQGDWVYGKFEARAKLPKGQGLWPAIWMMPTESVYGGWPRSGEIDIMELVGHEPATVHGTVHYGPAWPNNLERGGSYTLDEGTFNDGFHTFTIIWEPNRIRWFVDDQLYVLVTPNHLAPHNWPFDQKFHFIVNVAVGGNWPGNPDATTEFPQEMIVDYVRVYQDPELVTSSEQTDNPGAYQLHQNYPNPFNPTTQISFDLPQSSNVRVEVYDIMGRQVSIAANDFYQAGTHSVTFDAGSLSSGTYMYRLVTDTYSETRPMLLIK